MALAIKQAGALAHWSCPTPFEALVGLRSKGQTTPLMAGTRLLPSPITSYFERCGKTSTSPQLKDYPHYNFGRGGSQDFIGIQSR